MNSATYAAADTALLLVDPYNDFLSEGGKLWPPVQASAGEQNLLANTCIETTAKYAMELGYQVTLVSDATAAFSKEALHSAHHINGPTYASAILSTSALLHAFE